MTECIEQRISERFEILDILTRSAIVGDCRGLIISGAPGVGKSYGVENILRDYDPEGEVYEIVKGFTRATGLLKLLYKYRHEGNVLVFDDCDSAFSDEVALNLLKSVTDTTKRRVVSWLAESNMIDDETYEKIPRHFEFNGSVIVLTNLDFESMVEKGHKLSPHLEAIMSRSHYLDLSMRTREDYLVRIRQVIRNGLLSDLTPEARADVITFIERNYQVMRELSIRACVKLANLRIASDSWEKIARITCLKS